MDRVRATCSPPLGTYPRLRAGGREPSIRRSDRALCDRAAARPNNILQILIFVNVFEYFCLNKAKTPFRRSGKFGILFFYIEHALSFIYNETRHSIGGDALRHPFIWSVATVAKY